jgi:hypothetical protein
VASSVATSRKKSKIKLTLVQDSLEPDEADFFKDLTALPLTFNGQAADTGGGYYATADVMTNVVDSSSGSPGEQALGVATFQPDVVVLTGPLWASSFVAGLETRWTVLNHGVPPPVYVMMRELPSLATYAKLQGWADGRMYALDVSRDATVQANYGTVLGTLEGVGVTQETAEPYGLTEFNDALFAAMYAVVVSGGIQQTSVLAPAMLTLSQGANMVSLVLPSVPQMLGLIGQKVTTEMVGATDYLGFDSSTAVPSPATGAYCLGSHASSSPYAWTPAGVTYDAKTGSPTGTLACP